MFRREISRARTFGFMRDVEKLWSAGFALGASLENTVAIGDDGIMNPEGLRYADEFVRHKLLDAVGDLVARRPAAARHLPLLLRRSSHELLGARGPVLEPLQLRHRRCRCRAASRGYADLGSVAASVFAPEMH